MSYLLTWNFSPRTCCFKKTGEESGGEGGGRGDRDGEYM